MALVLVVDDEADMRGIVRLNLELAGHEVRESVDGLAALRVIAGGLRPDLVVLDVVMPELDGWETLTRMKADPAADVASVPVILLTALGSDMDHVRGGIEGALHHLAKPFSVDLLMRAVEEALAVDEPEARRRAQRAALGQLARLERGEEIDHEAPPETPPARVRFSRLERQRSTSPPAASPAASAAPGAALDLSTLSAKQRALLLAVGSHETVSDAASSLGVSRSNVYASLRRIARKLDVPAVPELVVIARRGDLEA